MDRSVYFIDPKLGNETQLKQFIHMQLCVRIDLVVSTTLGQVTECVCACVEFVLPVDSRKQ